MVSTPAVTVDSAPAFLQSLGLITGEARPDEGNVEVQPVGPGPDEAIAVNTEGAHTLIQDGHERIEIVVEEMQVPCGHARTIQVEHDAQDVPACGRSKPAGQRATIATSPELGELERTPVLGRISEHLLAEVGLNGAGGFEGLLEHLVVGSPTVEEEIGGVRAPPGRG